MKAEGRPLYILMLSPHGLVRGKNPELGRDADTGGQVLYVLELVRALGRLPGIRKVDLVTRLIQDEGVSSDYAAPEESLGGTARIVRIPFGPRRYIRKELFWNHLDTLVDRCLQLLREQGDLPDVIHSHYADAAYVGRLLSQSLGVPQIHTGHSLGRVKRQRLLAAGRKESSLERQFNFNRRIAAEEEAVAHASLVIASTRQEMTEQWALYENFDARRSQVIPPGVDTARFSPWREDRDEQAAALVDKFLRQPRKPLILTICRPAERKNLHRLLVAYGEDQALQEKANLAIVAGNREDIRGLDEDERRVYTDLLLDVDRHDLWGRVAIPKKHRREDVPALYRIAARRHGVFVNPALTEPFGLTLIEAAASGLPVVATEDGGPRDIIENCRNGLLVDPLDPAAIATALRSALSDAERWRTWARNGLHGVRRHYTWEAHVKSYLKSVNQLRRRERKRVRRTFALSRGGAGFRIRSVGHFLVSDIDNTLLGDREGLRVLLRWLRRNRSRVGFGVATGRVLPRALAVLSEWDVPVPDVLITGVGSEVTWGPDLQRDEDWSRHIRHGWRPDAIEGAVSSLPGLTRQPDEKQGEFKVSYDVDPETAPPIEQITRLLNSRSLQARLIFSHEKYLDVLPARASKGLAIRYLAFRQKLPLQRFLVAGDSGNDVEMLLGDTLGIVVGNHSPEVEPLRGLDQIYFAEASYARGILEGIRHYGFAARPAGEPGRTATLA
ncbi:MAG: HAD-IIB family hydrolase [Acidithiobacillales bacterium]